jgi:formylglycine-generating enzyme required for sulfatase activity
MRALQALRVLRGVLLALLAAASMMPSARCAPHAQDAPEVLRPVAVFSDCQRCPAMVVIPAGSNVMGSTPEERVRAGVPAAFGDREGPRHEVTIAAPFALARTEVTRGEYGAFVAQTHRPDPADCAAHDVSTDKWLPKAGYSWRNPGYTQSDQHPAVCISYADAVAYAEWLAQQTGKPYRLASEAEWEYAARGGTTTAWYWGDDPGPGCERANLISSGTVLALGSPAYWRGKLICQDPAAYSREVASFAPNPFGLYDMIGNAFEWVADCSSAGYAGAPTDGSALLTENCTQHFLKGGAFHTPLWLTRAAMRGNPLNPDVHMNTIGFRVARRLD